MTLGQNIARLRTQKNLSQGDLADALEVSRQSVSKWETDASIPELDKLLRLAELFGVTLDELVKGESAQPEAARGEAPDKENAGAYTAAAPAARREKRQIVGTILLCFGALIAILIMLFAGTLAGFILALPLFVCGTICLTVRHASRIRCTTTCLAVCAAMRPKSFGVTLNSRTSPILQFSSNSLASSSVSSPYSSITSSSETTFLRIYTSISPLTLSILTLTFCEFP